MYISCYAAKLFKYNLMKEIFLCTNLMKSSLFDMTFKVISFVKADELIMIYDIVCDWIIV